MIVGLIVAAVAPMVFSTLAATRLTSAGETLAAHLSLAKQLATSRNEPVEVRFYSYPDPEVPGSKEEVRAVSIMRVTPAASLATAGTVAMEALVPIFYLPSGIVMGKATALSPIFAGSLLTTQSDNEHVIKRSGRATYKAFRFQSDGSPNLATLMGSYKPNQSYLTLVEEKATGATNDIPKNFYTVQIDPSTGKTSTYRP